MAKVYGYSDDIVCIEHLGGGCTEVDCFDKDVRIRFDDGTTIRIGYPKADMAVWWIEKEKVGTAISELRYCEDENAKIYSDIFEIEAEIKSFSVIKQRGAEDGKSVCL